jgi:hypothetical protein
MKALLGSRKFLLILVDAAFVLFGGAAAFFVSDPEWQKFIAFVLASLQPVFVAAIVGIVAEDRKAMEMGTHPSQGRG